MVIKKNITTVQKSIIALSTFLLVIGIFLVTYYITSNKTSSRFIDFIINQKQRIDEANSKAASSLKNLDKLKSNDKEKLTNIISIVTTSEKTISQSLDELKKMNPPDKLKKQFDNYIEAVSLNRRIMYQTCLILKNPRSKDLQKALDALDKYISDTKKAYASIKLEKSVIKLPEDIISLPENIRQYSSVVYNDYTVKTNALEQYSQYFDSMDPLVYDFKNEMSDLNNYILLIKDGQTSIESVYTELEKKLMKLTEVKNRYIKISLPPKIIEQHKVFKTLLEKYTYYCQDFKASLVILGEAGANKEKLIEINAEFDKLTTRYKKIEGDYGNFSQNYEGNKAFYKDVSNL